MLLSVSWGHIQEQTTNFEPLVHETWPRTYGPVVFKLYKKQTLSENHETCRDVMISCVKAVIKSWQRFVKVVTYDAYKPKNLRRSFMISCGGRRGGKHRTWQSFTKCCQIFITSFTHDIMTSWQVSWFSDLVCFLYDLKITGSQVRGHVSWIRHSKFVVCSWIRSQLTLNNMNIIFPSIFSIIRMICSSNLNYPKKSN